MRLVGIAVGWCIGVGIVVMGGTQLPLYWFTLVLASLIGVIYSGTAWRRWLFVILLAMTTGGLRASFIEYSDTATGLIDQNALTLEGVIVNEPDYRDDRVQFYLQANRVTFAGQTYGLRAKILVRAAPLTAVQYGDSINATGHLFYPGTFDNFSYDDYLARDRVFSLMDDAAVTVMSSGNGNALHLHMLNIKHRAQQHIATMLPEPEAGLLTGILLGNERGISPELRDAFAITGASHIIAISGFNMVVLAGLISTVLKRWRGNAIVSFVVIMLYTVFVGAGASVVRAAVMSIVLVMGRALKRRSYVPASLAFVVLFMSAINPLVLWDVGFQLSFFAVFGMALFADPLSRWLKKTLDWGFPPPISKTVSALLGESIAVTMAALVLTLPLTALYFNQVSIVQLLVNVLIVPLQAAILIVGGLALITAFLLPPVAQLLFWVDMLLLNWTIGVVRFAARLPLAAVQTYPPSEMIVLFIGGIMGFSIVVAARPRPFRWLAHNFRRRTVLAGMSLTATSLIILTVMLMFSRPDGRLHVWFLDVGHSNAVFIQSPDGAQILIDGGRFPSRLLTQIGDRMPFNDRHIELLIITQPDEFQFGALPTLLTRYDVGAVIMNGQPNQSEAFAVLQDALADVPIVEAKTGYRASLSDGTDIDVLNPLNSPKLDDSLDENTVVFRVQYGDARFLFTGDANDVAQERLLASNLIGNETVLQIPQHGGTRALSDAFLERVQPQLVILQSDRANRLDDPHIDTLAQLEGYPLFRTDIDGVIHVVTNGEMVRVLRNR